MKKTIPDLCSEKIKCCGCSACQAVCPAQAITMEPDEKGFLYPIISEEKCIRCYKCYYICAFKKEL